MSRAVLLRVGPRADSTRAPRFARRSLDASQVALLAGSLVIGPLAVLEVMSPQPVRSAFDSLQAALGPALAVYAIFRFGRYSRALRYRTLALSMALATIGMTVLDLEPVLGRSLTPLLANVVFGVGASLGFWAIVPALYRRLDRAAAVSAGLDGLIMLLAGVTVLVTLWQWHLGEPGSPADLIMPGLVTMVFASAGAAVIAALAMRAEPAFRGVWCGIAGVGLLGLSWIVWLDRPMRGASRQPPETILFAAGVVVLAYGWLTWNERIGRGRLYDRVAGELADWLPNAAIVACVGLAAWPHERVGGPDPAAIGTVGVVLAAIARQRLLLVNERHTALRLSGEVGERAATMLSLTRLEPAPTAQATALRVCTEALRLAGIETCALFAFSPNGDVVRLAWREAAAGPSGEAAASAPEAGTDEDPADAVLPLHPDQAMYLRANSSLGPWLDVPIADAMTRTARPLLREAFAPMRWNDMEIGVVSMGVRDRAQALRLGERLPTVAEFAVVSAAMLGPLLAEHWRQADLRRELEELMAERAFTPVFQPILELDTKRVVGYEALTRFADGTRPDKRFMDAASVGMSVRLERVCLLEQLEAATYLPPAAWVSLNVSPALAIAVIPLTAALEQTDRAVVMEVTEHVEIADYVSLAAALAPLRTRARLAVDDAGAGYAGLRHILELRPDFVKLDISLVRSIDTDAARQAMVAGMAHFAANAGCQLIAEGIETADELAALVRLGIPLGQGYLLGRPAPLD